MTSAGTGKTYASAFAMRELGFKRVLFLVHRGELARQTKKSYSIVFNDNVKMGIVGSNKYEPDHFDCIILDEAHHRSADTYQKVMAYFKPKLWL